jgi:hypothetical protein
MLGSFLPPVRHLSLDDPRIPPVSTRPQSLMPDLPQEPSIPRLGIDVRRLGQLTLQHSERVDEGEPVRILAGHHRRVVHHSPHHVVRQHQAIDLLHHPRRRLAPDRDRPAAQVGLDLIKGQLFFPPLVVDQRRFVRRHILRVGQVGDQPVPLARPGAVRVVVGILDHPHQEAAHVPATVGRTRVDLGQVRAVGQPADRPQDGVALDPRQQVGAPPDDCGDQFVAEEAAVPDQEHARPEVVQQRADHRRLAVAQRLDRQAADGVRAQLTEGQQPDLREGPLGPARRGAAEGACVVRGIGQIERGAVEAHQPPASVERPDRLVSGHGASGLKEQVPQGGDAEPAAGLGEGGVGRLGLVAGRVESAPGLGDRVGGEEGHGDDQPDDGIGGEAPPPFRRPRGP